MQHDLAGLIAVAEDVLHRHGREGGDVGAHTVALAVLETAEEVQQLRAERDAALAETEAVKEENKRLHRLFDDSRQGDGHELCRAALAELGPAARAWRAARTAFGATRMEAEHDVLWAATERLEAAVDALGAGVGASGAQAANGAITWTEAADIVARQVLDAEARREALAEAEAATLDAELADINARVAADERVLDAAEAQRDAYAAADANLTNEAIVALRAAGKELAAAVDARRALTGEQTEH